MATKSTVTAQMLPPPAPGGSAVGSRPRQSESLSESQFSSLLSAMQESERRLDRKLADFRSDVRQAQQMECGKRSTANSGSGHDDSAHSIPGSSVRIHSDSDVENNRGEATTVEPGSPGSFLGQQQ